MSSYRSNYGRFTGTSSSGIGSSTYSPASSTSSLASSASTGGSSSKFSSSLTSGLKSSESTPSRESSFTSGLSSGSGRLSRFSSTLSSRGDSASGNNPSNYGSSNLSAGSKTNYGPSSFSKDKPSSTGNGYGLASVSSISSKYTSSDSSTLYRPSSSLSSYSKTIESSGGKDPISTKSKMSCPDSQKPYSSSSSCLQGKDSLGTSKGTNAVASTSETETKNSTSGSTGYNRPYTTRNFGGSSDAAALNSSAVSSALRTTARFGIRSGTTHALYSSSLPTASTLKAAAKLAEETKKELSKKESSKKLEKDAIIVSWISRGTCTFLDNKKKSEEKEEEDDEITPGISNMEVPTFEPRVFSSRYDGVLKPKGIQTEEEAKPKILPSAIPRPSVSMNYYSTFGNPMPRFSSTRNTPVSQQQETNDSEQFISSKSTLENVGSFKDAEINSSSNFKASSSINNNSHNKTPGTMTSGDQSSRSSHQTINNTNVAESSSNCNNGTETSTSGNTTTMTNSTTSPTRGNNNMNKISSVASNQTSGFVISVANKEFRKSALNVGLDSKDAEVEFAKKQEELRMKKMHAENSTSPSPSAVINNNSKDNQNNSSISSLPSLLSNMKRDPPSRPPTDLSKLVTSLSGLSNIKSINCIPSQENIAEIQNFSDSNNNAKFSSSGISSNSKEIGLIKIKSTKSLIQLRKLSTTSSDSESSVSVGTASIKTNTSSCTKVKKKIILSNGSNNNLDNKGQVRRGSATSSSSTVSSRSNSVERNAQNNCNNHNDHNQLMNSITNTIVKQEKGSGISNLLNTVNKPPSGSLSFKKDTSSSTITLTAVTKAKLSTKKAVSKVEKIFPHQTPNILSLIEEPKTDTAAQTSYLLRTLGSAEKPWVRKCQSGELPWWLTSNPDVPSLLGKSLMRNPTSKDLDTQEEIQVHTQEDKDDSSTSALSDCSDAEEESDHKRKYSLGERTSPDGIEVEVSPELNKSSSNTLTRKGSLDSSQARNNTKTSERKNSLFISNLTNIDDILGTVSPALIPNSPSLAPINFSEAELCKAQRKMSLKEKESEDSEDESSSSDDSSSSEIQDKFDKKNQFNEDSELEGSSDDDDASTGTSSSFELDPSSIKALASTNKLESTLSPGSSQVINTQSISTISGMIHPNKQPEELDDATLQLYKDGECGTYLDLESSISEQQEDFDGFQNNRKNSIVLRAQLSVRVHAIIEKLLTADGRELRRALFSLKQIFQEDKDLVHEFVENGGLSCLIKVGSEAKTDYQNYILRAIGQVMLYVDGMYGVMRHNETIQWLYCLVASKFRLVQKTALKLLLVFVDYVETNCLLLVEAVSAVDTNKGLEPWSNIMALLCEHDSNSGDTELLVYAMTLVNKVFNGIPDIDTYYNQVDALEEQGMATIIQSYMGKQCADLDLLKQFQIYELVLKHEDGEEDNIMMQLDETMRTKLLNRKGYNETDNKERRKSRRYSTSTPLTTPNGSVVPNFPRRLSSADITPRDSPYSSLSSSGSNGMTNGSSMILNGHSKDKELTPGLRRRRERAEHQKNLTLEQLVNGSSNGLGEPESPIESPNSPVTLIPLGRSQGSKKDISCLEQENNLKNNITIMNGSNNAARPWMLPIYTKTNGTASSLNNISNGIVNGEKEAGDFSESEKAMQLKKENTVKDLTQKLASQNLLASPAEENKSFIDTGELSGVVSKAKEGLAKSKSRADMLKPLQQDNNANGTTNKGIQLEVKKSDNELHWDFLVNNLQRELEICDLDFTDLKCSDDEDILAPDPSLMNNCYGFPPPVPMMTNGNPPPPPPSVGKFGAPPPPFNGLALSSPLFGVSLKSSTGNSQDGMDNGSNTGPKKTKKTVKLFWKEVRDDPITASKVEKVGCIWNELSSIPVDTQKLEHLFESRAKDVINKKQSDVNKTKEIVVLDPKRSNAINIGMTKLPPPRTIKAAIMKMDSTIINREGIEKLLTMLPTEEERAKITEAQFANPETPLGSAEQFLLTLSSISELTPRLKLWAFKLDYENLEREVAEPLMDLKTGICVLEKNKTFRYILSTLLSIGNFLNGADAKGFQIEYLSKVPEVKDTVQKHSLLHHLCQTVNENHPESTDLYSEIGPVTRASRVDFDEISTNLTKMENDCKTSWDYLRVIAKHDGPTNLKLKLSEFLADCAERIIVLGMIHRRIMNRFKRFLLWLGVPAHQVITTKPHTLFKIVSEFALEYRTTRERVIQQLQKKANHRERNKTRGKMITEQIVAYKSKEDQEDADLREVLSKSTSNGTEAEVVRGSLTWKRQKSQPGNGSTPNTPTGTLYHNFKNNRTSSLNGNPSLPDGDDEILESLVKTATRTSVATRERKRINGTRNITTERKSLRRTLRHGLSEEERKMLATFMANGHSFY